RVWIAEVRVADIGIVRRFEVRKRSRSRLWVSSMILRKTGSRCPTRGDANAAAIRGCMVLGPGPRSSRGGSGRGVRSGVMEGAILRAWDRAGQLHGGTGPGAGRNRAPEAPHAPAVRRGAWAVAREGAPRR